MASTSDDESQQNLILGLAIGIIALVLFLVLGIALLASARHAPVMPAAVAVGAPGTLAVVTETVIVEIPDGAGIRVTDGVVNFYFATGSADLAPGAAEALVAVIKGVESGRTAVLSGYHDTTGDAALNEELSKKRAQTVREVLIGLGLPADKINLLKPAETTASGSDAQARRVEVKLVD